jgi:MFS family permease
MTAEPATRHSQRALLAIFATLYFVQGTAEPTAGLVAQPVRSLLRSWGQGADQIAAFMFIVGFPWYTKPLFGLLTDFLPIRGYRRRSYFILASVLSIVGLFAAALLPLPEGATTLLVLLLILPSIGIAFTDVVTDAYMVDTGQPLGITGRLQSAQWTAAYTAGLLTGVIGGYLSEHSLQQVGFLVCGVLSAITLYIALFKVDEVPHHRIQPGQFKRALVALRNGVRNRTVLVVGGFLFFINFNPFSADVLYIHMTESLGFSEQFVGTTYTLSSAGSILACVMYGIFSPRIPLKVLIHGSISLMILSSLVYLGLAGTTSAVIVSVVYGFIYLVTSLIQLDLAARYCPPGSAGTVFAALMALYNLSISLSAIVGGRLYTSWLPTMGPERAFTVLVFVGAAFTAGCWVLYHFFPLERERAA